jgi:TrkA domain protein
VTVDSPFVPEEGKAMSEIRETALPGVGVRLEFTTDAGGRIGVVHHWSGRRELFVCTPDDPDAAALVLDLSDDERHALVDALGGSQVVESLSDLEQRVEGLVIDWLVVAETSPYAERTIGDAGVRTRTGVSVVAVIRGTTAHPAPGPEFTIEPADTLVVVGVAEGIESVRQILETG